MFKAGFKQEGWRKREGKGLRKHSNPNCLFQELSWEPNLMASTYISSSHGNLFPHENREGQECELSAPTVEGGKGHWEWLWSSQSAASGSVPLVCSILHRGLTIACLSLVPHTNVGAHGPLGHVRQPPEMWVLWPHVCVTAYLSLNTGHAIAYHRAIWASASLYRVYHDFFLLI